MRVHTSEVHTVVIVHHNRVILVAFVRISLPLYLTTIISHLSHFLLGGESSYCRLVIYLLIFNVYCMY